MQVSDQAWDESMTPETAAFGRAPRDLRVLISNRCWRGLERWDARDRVREDVDRVLSRWHNG